MTAREAMDKTCPIMGVNLAPVQSISIERPGQMTLQPVTTPCVGNHCMLWDNDGCMIYSFLKNTEIANPNG